ncbi:MAG: hypothetical protein NTU69_05360 [Proteobacteria bacterium]|nr:hypothetical protein [Pseudomonadota bacterium]
MNTSKIIYSINIEDIQNVAEEYLGRQASKKELRIVENKVGDYIDWHEAIVLAIDDAVTIKKNRKNM